MTSAESTLDPGSLIASVRIHTLGGFRVTVGGRPLQFETRAHRKPLELLKVLIALGGENVSEIPLSEALWPDADGDAAHASFATTLHRLRRLIGSDTLHMRDKRLSLDPALCRVDAFAFERTMEQAAAAISSGDRASGSLLEEGLALYLGPFLEGEFEPPEILPARERYHGIFLRNVEEAGRAFQESGNFSQAIALYRKALEIDPLSESLSRELMRCLLAAGEAAEGLVVFRRCRDLLRSTFDINPTSETEAVHQALMTIEPKNVPSESIPPATPEEPPPAASRSMFRRGTGLLVALVLVGVLVAAGGFAGWTYYQARSAAAAVAAFKQSASFPLPDRPSIAVLAFNNLSGDPGQEYFSDGLGEDIITKLASLSPLFVIARNSSFRYKGKQVDVRQIGRELGVRYVLEGSVRKSAGRVRITAQLIDAATGEHLFAKTYERELKDIFAVQDEIANQVLAELQVKLGTGEAIFYALRVTNNFEAFDAYLRAAKFYWAFEKQANFKAEELLLKALELDPDFAPAMSLLGWVYFDQAWRPWVPDPKKAYRLAANWARRSVEANPNQPGGLVLLARFESQKGNFEKSIAMGKRAVEFQPSHAHVISSLAFSFLLARQPEGALETINKAMRLAPYPPAFFNWVAGMANAWIGRHEVAVSEYKKVLAKLKGGPQRAASWVGLIVAYTNLGQQDQAKAATEKLIKAYPGFTISGYVREKKGLTYKDFDWLENQAEILRKLGLPE